MKIGNGISQHWATRKKMRAKKNKEREGKKVALVVIGGGLCCVVLIKKQVNGEYLYTVRMKTLWKLFNKLQQCFSNHEIYGNSFIRCQASHSHTLCYNVKQKMVSKIGYKASTQGTYLPIHCTLTLLLPVSQLCMYRQTLPPTLRHLVSLLSVNALQRGRPSVESHISRGYFRHQEVIGLTA